MKAILAAIWVGIIAASSGSAAAQSATANYTSDSGWTAFQYPPGWEVFPTDRTPARYLENFAIQPRGQSFAGGRGQVVFRIFDPMYVVEEAGVRLPVGHDALFQRFVRALPGGSSASFSTTTVGGRLYYYASESSEGFTTVYVGSVTANRWLTVVGMAVAPQDVASRQPLLFQIAASVRAPGPSPASSGPTGAVSSWYSNLQRGNSIALTNLQCSQAALANGIISLVTGNSIDRTIQLGRLFDYSGLQYQTIQSNGTRAVVRVSGNVVAANGSVVPFYRYAANIGGSNSFFTPYESGAWRVCGPVRGGNR